MRNTKYKEFSAGRAGIGSINLATGVLNFVHEDTGSDANILPINISHVYSSNRASETKAYGQGFKLNLQQTLKKSEPNNSNDTKYIYTDAAGTEHIFEDRYYYIDADAKRVYLSTLSNIIIDADGKLTYENSLGIFDVFTQQVTESGLTLQSELKEFKGSKKLETRHEDIVQLTEEIFQYEKMIADLEYNVVQYGKNDKAEYTDLLTLQNEIEVLSIEIQKISNEIEFADTNEESPDNKKNLKTKKESLNTKQETLRVKQNKYEETERGELKTRYEYLKGIADEEIKKYTNLKENKQDVLKKLTSQIPVNFIVGKDNLTFGFNADGNLVALFDSYDNQAAIVYENGVIAKVIDADNREIVFEYERKNSSRGKLVSITDYKGHKTCFIYETSNDDSTSGTKDYLRKIIYPNGETTEFAYIGELLSEMLSPSKIGAQILYNANKKVKSIANLTMANKIDKKGVSYGEKVAEPIVTLTYAVGKTDVSDAKNEEKESNYFSTDGKVYRTETMQDDKLTSFTAYGDSKIYETGRRCDFVMTNDDIGKKTLIEIDLMSATDSNSVTLSGAESAWKDWSANLNKLDSGSADYILCGTATATTAEKSPLRKKTAYCKDYCKQDTHSACRFEYKVLVDYAEEYSNYYIPIKTGDTIEKLQLNDKLHLKEEFYIYDKYYLKEELLQSDKLFPKADFVNPPIDNYIFLPVDNSNNMTGDKFYDSFGVATIAEDGKKYYPILGKGNFDLKDLSHQLYYTEENYTEYETCPDFNKVPVACCALWAGDILLWGNLLYKWRYDSNEIPSWQQTEVDISEWGPITVHCSDYMHKWGQFLSTDATFHNGSIKEPNTSSDIDEFIAGFDYKIKVSQHVAIPITLRMEDGKPKKPKKITVIAHYKQSQGVAVFQRPILTKGKVAYSWLDESGNTVFESVSDAEKIAVNEQPGIYSTVKPSVATVYNDNNLPTEKRTLHAYTTKIGKITQTTVEKWFYNPQGRVIEHWSYTDGDELASGIDITETVYDSRGNAVKSFAYNSLDASTKFYQEQERTENGRVLADIDESGAHKTYYEYDDITGKVIATTAPNGGKFAYAHDTNTDEVTAITQSTEDGEGNTTNRVYTAGYITELSSGGNVVNFEYDNKGRKSAVYLNGTTPYSVYEYQERTGTATNDVVTATLAPTDSVLRYTVKTELNKDGNLVSAREGKDPQSLSDSIVNTYYTAEDKDREGLIKTSEDKTLGTKTEYTYNSLGQPTLSTVLKSGTITVVSSETAEYNTYGNLSKRNIVSGEYKYEYGYNYKDNLEKEFESLSMPYGLNSKPVSDANGRIKEHLLTLNDQKIAGEYYYFRKHGDHGTNQISSVRYGERKNGDYVIKDGVSYTYDACGNITEVKENGKLSSRYGYDKLSRLIREDNAKFCKTTLFTYDNNGNILTKRDAPFRLCETEKITEFMDEKEYTYDAKSPDRLLAFGNEEILGYDSIGNPNSYRGKSFAWQKGRQLASVTDNVETLSFSYDAKGMRMGKRADGECTKYVYVGDMLVREERCDENNILYFGDNLITGDNFIDGDEIVIDSVNKSVLEYFYGQDGVMGIVYNGEKYYFRRNIQGDISRIFALDGTLKACYTYDAWGNHIVFDADGNINTNPDFIGNINPYRYRGYYFDTEMGLYYTPGRYYDPEVGRWINADDIAYLDPESINGLNCTPIV